MWTTSLADALFNPDTIIEFPLKLQLKLSNLTAALFYYYFEEFELHYMLSSVL